MLEMRELLGKISEVISGTEGNTQHWGLVCWRILHLFIILWKYHTLWSLNISNFQKWDVFDSWTDFLMESYNIPMMWICSSFPKLSTSLFTSELLFTLFVKLMSVKFYTSYTITWSKFIPVAPCWLLKHSLNITLNKTTPEVYAFNWLKENSKKKETTVNWFSM